MTNENYTLYSSTTCTRCPLARKSMERAGVTYSEVTLDLPENERLLIDFRAEMAELGGRLEMPIVRTPDGRLLTNLATISAEFQKVSA